MRGRKGHVRERRSARRGRLPADRDRDLVEAGAGRLVDRDLLTINPEALMNAKVIWTMFEGIKVYESGNNN